MAGNLCSTQYGTAATVVTSKAAPAPSSRGFGSTQTPVRSAPASASFPKWRRKRGRQRLADARS
eukprot:2879688-Rhodomonas_salina.2